MSRWDVKALTSVAGIGAMLLATGCTAPDATVPTAEEVSAAYEYDGVLEAEVNGNVAEVTVYQPTRQLLRGGSLWAKVGPYVFLFSAETRALFDEYGGLAAVRVITRAPGGREVARALLTRDTLNEVTWRRALRVSGLARRDGSSRPGLLEDLVRWGEDHTEYEYSPRYISR